MNEPVIIRPLARGDLAPAAEMLCAVYNNEVWQCRWKKETALAYLEDFFDGKKFLGWGAFQGETLVGAMFCHEKIWWNNSEVFIEEMFVAPALQRRGIGTALVNAAGDWVRLHGLAGFTLTTNRRAFAPRFYEKNGFVDCPDIQYMAKVMV